MDIKFMENKLNLGFAAIDKQLITTVPSPTEGEARGKDYITWGDDNAYPEYLYNLYLDTDTLKTIIDGTADFVTGDNAVCNVEGFEKEVNKKGDTLSEIIHLCARDYKLYGAFAMQVIRRKDGNIGEIYYIDIRFLRCSKKRDLFWYSEEYNKKYQRTSKTVVYPKFVPEARDIPASIVYVTAEKTRTYPIPQYSGALRACEIERHIDEYHLAALENGFGASIIINFNGGIPDDEQKREIEKNVYEKWGGVSNAGSIMLNFSDDKDNAATVETLDVSDFGEKYKAAATRAREQIFTAFRAVPAIFGLMTESKGFAEEEFEQAFRLYNRTSVRPVQNVIADAFDKIFGIKGSITITPYSIDENNDENIVS